MKNCLRTTQLVSIQKQSHNRFRATETIGDHDQPAGREGQPPMNALLRPEGRLALQPRSRWFGGAAKEIITSILHTPLPHTLRAMHGDVNLFIIQVDVV